MHPSTSGAGTPDSPKHDRFPVNPIPAALPGRLLLQETDLNARSHALSTASQQAFEPRNNKALEVGKHKGNGDIASKTSSSLSRRSSIGENELARIPSTISLLDAPALDGVLTPFLPSSRDPSLPSSPAQSDRSSVLRCTDVKPAREDDLLQSTENSDLSVSLADDGPQLVMPSISIPSRRPFTERGRNIGRFKIMVAGKHNTGKTSLIKSIVQLCEDIVHVDALNASPPTTSKTGSSSSDRFTEVYASTKPYPQWWSDISTNRLKRTKCIGDAALERNICFVDTAGSDDSTILIDYMTRQIDRDLSLTNASTDEAVRVLGGRGGSQVDVILYLLSLDTLKEDFDHIGKLCPLANVVPLISKADLLSAEQIDKTKSLFKQSLVKDIVSKLRSDEITDGSRDYSLPFTIASVNCADTDMMDASTLMSSGYVQPLAPSELHLLVDKIFQPDAIAYLRYTSVKKLVQWRNSKIRLLPASTSQYKPLHQSYQRLPSQTLHFAAETLASSPSKLSLSTTDSLALAPYSGSVQQEIMLEQVRLSRWSGDIQTSLEKERECYESLARSGTASRPTDKIDEEAQDDKPVLLSVNENSTSRRDGKNKLYSFNGLFHQLHDPLHLISWQKRLTSQGWLVLQILGSFGVLGGIALWVTRAIGYHTRIHQWAQDWGVLHD